MYSYTQKSCFLLFKRKCVSVYRTCSLTDDDADDIVNHNHFIHWYIMKFVIISNYLHYIMLCWHIRRLFATKEWNSSMDGFDVDEKCLVLIEWCLFSLSEREKKKNWFTSEAILCHLFDHPCLPLDHVFNLVNGFVSQPHQRQCECGSTDEVVSSTTIAIAEATIGTFSTVTTKA